MKSYESFKYFRLLVNLFWLAFVYNLITPFAEPYSVITLGAGVILLVAHLFEYLVMYKKLDEHGLTGAAGFVLIMLYGLFYWLPVVNK